MSRFQRCPTFNDLCQRAARRDCHVGITTGDELLERETHPHRELTSITVSQQRSLLVRVPITRGNLAAAARSAIDQLRWA